MAKPKITKEKIDTLLRCLVDEFTKEHQDSTHKLSEKVFYLTDRMGCCKKAGLNYEYPATASDGQKVRMNNSIYKDAVSELEHRGYIAFMDNHQQFVLTGKGYNAVRRNIQKMGKLHFIEQFYKSHAGLVQISLLVVAVFGSVLGFLSWYNG